MHFTQSIYVILFPTTFESSSGPALFLYGNQLSGAEQDSCGAAYCGSYLGSPAISLYFWNQDSKG